MVGNDCGKKKGSGEEGEGQAAFAARGLGGSALRGDQLGCAAGSGAASSGSYLGRQLAAAVGAGDQLVAALVLGDEARLHAEVDRLRVVGDDRHRRLLRHHRVAVGQRHADLLEPEQAPDLLVLGLVRAGGVAPGVAAALVGLDPEPAAHLECSHSARPSADCTPRPWMKSCSANSPSALELVDQLGHLGADRDALEGDDVALARVERPVEVGEADPVVLRLAREDEALELALGVLGVEDDQLVAIGVAGEVPSRARGWR